MLASRQAVRMISQRAPPVVQATPRPAGASARTTPPTLASIDSGKAVPRGSASGRTPVRSPHTPLHFEPIVLGSTSSSLNLAGPTEERDDQVAIAFISGPVKADAAYFQAHYAPRILTAIKAGHHFVLGSSKGVDSLALAYLLSYPKSGSATNTNPEALTVDRRRITVYLTQSEALNPKVRHSLRLKQLEQGGGRVISFEPPVVSEQVPHAMGRREPNLHWTQRDEGMTRASHYDILRYRTEEECRVLYGMKYRKRVSGTEKNELRRTSGAGLKLVEIPHPFDSASLRMQ